MKPFAEQLVDTRGVGAALALGLGVGAGFVAVVGAAILPPIVLVLMAVGGAVAVAMLFSPRLAILITALVVPIERLGRFSDDSAAHLFSLMRIVGLLAFASFALHALLRKQRIRLDAPAFLYGGFVAVVLLSYFYSSQPDAARGQFYTNAGNLMFFLLLINVVRDWKLAKHAVMAWVGISTLIGVYQIYGWYFGTAIEADQLGATAQRFATVWNSESEQAIGAVRRATGTTSNAAVYGINMILTLPFLAFFLRTTRSRWWQATIAAAGIVVLYNLMLTNTRAVMVFGTVAVASILVFKLLRPTPKLLLAGTLMLLPLLAVVPDSVYRRALDPSNYSLAKSNNIRGRLALWDASIQAFEERWLLGWGAGNRTVLYGFTNSPDVDHEIISSHNAYLQSLVEVGIVGSAFFFLFVLTVHRQAFTAMKIFRDNGDKEQYWFLVACQLAMLNVLAFGVQVDVFHFPLKGWWLVAGISCAMLAVANRSARQLPDGSGAPAPR